MVGGGEAWGRYARPRRASRPNYRVIPRLKHAVQHVGNPGSELCTSVRDCCCCPATTQKNSWQALASRSPRRSHSYPSVFSWCPALLCCPPPSWFQPPPRINTSSSSTGSSRSKSSDRRLLAKPRRCSPRLLLPRLALPTPGCPSRAVIATVPAPAQPK